MHTRAFNPNSSDQQVESCCICLDIFNSKDTRMIAELGCNSKHIFHVDCLNCWVETNDVCPMCREPILKDVPDLDMTE